MIFLLFYIFFYLSDKTELGDCSYNSNLILKNEGLNAKRKADIYSFAIILFEIVGRKGPWGDLINPKELQPEHSYFRTTSNLMKKKRFFTINDNEILDEIHIHRSFSDSMSSTNKLPNYENNSLSKADDNSEINSKFLGTELKRDLFSKSFANHDNSNRTRSSNQKLKELGWPSKQMSLYKAKEQSLCLINDFDQSGRLDHFKRKTFDGLLCSKKSLDERSNNLNNIPNNKLKIEDIVDRVRDPAKYSIAIFRPDISSLKNCSLYLSNCIQLCWSEKPEARPDMKQVNSMLRELQTGLKSNIFDNMIALLEKHANNLEELVEKRTKMLVEEKKKTETLLLRMLPK